MEIKREGNIIVAKFVNGEILDNMKRLAKKENIDSAIILSAIGMLENAEIGYFNGKEYKVERMEKPMELVSLQGNIGRGDDIICHFHVALAGENHELKGGHLLRGDVKVVNEIALYCLKELKIRRKKNDVGIMEMFLEE
ncbi:DNA-binding protein [Thermoplasmatales archaeon ex4484_30]|nr:MAG: DNA-binding protein [Thermoplasmatales archaeon ex4484_30]RLF45162.1 MAG: DNA-binding protein [Thermoplasmata archaeon]